MRVINSKSEITELIDSETLSKYTIVVMLNNDGRLEPGLLTPLFNNDIIIFDGIYLWHDECHHNINSRWTWPTVSRYHKDRIVDLMKYIWDVHTNGRWSTKFYILQNPGDVSEFIKEFNITDSHFINMLNRRFVTERCATLKRRRS